jgi:DNA polymerase
LLIVKPRAVVALGATAAQSLMGSQFRVTRDGGSIIAATPWAEIFLATAHPSSILRKLTSEDRREAYAALVRDLKLVAAAMTRTAAPGRTARGPTTRPRGERAPVRPRTGRITD